MRSSHGNMQRSRGNRGIFFGYFAPVNFYNKGGMKVPIGFILGLLLGYTLSWTVRVSFELPAQWTSPLPHSRAREGISQQLSSDQKNEVQRSILNNNNDDDDDVNGGLDALKRRVEENGGDPFDEDMEDVDPVIEDAEVSDGPPGAKSAKVAKNEDVPAAGPSVVTVTRSQVCKNGKYLVGVLIGEDRLLSMAYAIHATWGSIEGVSMFSTAHIDPSHLPSGIKVASIPDQTESRVSEMLAGILPHFEKSSDADWVVLTQDTVYVQILRLEEYLGTLDPKQEACFGLQPAPEVPQCSFASALVLSRPALARVGGAEGLRRCVGRYSRQDGDVEGDSVLHQCLRAAGVACRPAPKADSIYRKDTELWNSAEFFSSRLMDNVFLWPMQYPKYVYRVHVYFELKKLAEMTEEVQFVKENIEALQHFVPTRLRTDVNVVQSSSDETSDGFLSNSPIMAIHPVRMLEIATWEFFNQSKLMNPLGMYPSTSLVGQLRTELKWGLTTGLVEAKRMAGERVSFVKVDSAYRRLDASKGLQFVMDYVVKNVQGVHKVHRVGMLLPLARAPIVLKNIAGERKQVNFLTTISRVGSRLGSFLTMFHRLYTQQKERVGLTIVLFKGPDEDEVLQTVNTFLSEQEMDSSAVRVHTIGGQFARGVGLDKGMELFQQDDLVYIIDIDLVLDNLALDRCQLNTIQGKQVYFPIFFKLYSEKFINSIAGTKSTPVISRNLGHWAHYSYGMLCIYASDYRHTAGYSTELRGWGEEDILLVDEILKLKLEVFRSPDPGLIHLWHDKHCDPSVIQEPEVLYHCQRSKAENVADRIELANYLFQLWTEHPELKPKL